MVVVVSVGSGVVLSSYVDNGVAGVEECWVSSSNELRAGSHDLVCYSMSVTSWGVDRALTDLWYAGSRRSM